jgi:uncharacterized membrane protein
MESFLNVSRKYRRADRALLWGLTGAAIAYYLWVCWTRYLSARFRFFEVGHIDSVLFNAFVPGWRFYSYHTGYNHFGNHFTPIFFPLATLRLIFPHPFLLAGCGDASVALGGAGVWLLARRESGSRVVATLFALLYWRNYWIASVALANHFESLWMGPALLGFYYFRARKWGWFWAWWLLGVSVKEDLALYMVALGAWAAWGARPRERRQGFALMAFGLAYGLIAGATMAYILKDAERSYYYGPRYWPPDVDPLHLLTMSAKLLGSVGFLGLLHPRSLPLLMVPAAVCLFSKYELQREMLYYYSYGVAPFLFFNAILGAGRLLRWGRARGRRKAARWTLTALLGLLTLAQAAIPTRSDGERHLPFAVEARHQQMRDMGQAAFPPEARVMAQEHLYCFVPQRFGLVPLAPPAGLPTRVEFAPGLFESAEYIWLDFATPAYNLPAESTRALLATLDAEVARGAAKVLFRDPSGLMIYQRFKNNR